MFSGKLAVLREDELTAAVTAQATGYLETLFHEPSSPGSVMAGRTERGIGDPEQVAAAVSVLANDLLESVSGSCG